MYTSARVLKIIFWFKNQNMGKKIWSLLKNHIMDEKLYSDLEILFSVKNIIMIKKSDAE